VGASNVQSPSPPDFRLGSLNYRRADGPPGDRLRNYREVGRYSMLRMPNKTHIVSRRGGSETRPEQRTPSTGRVSDPPLRTVLLRAPGFDPASRKESWTQ